MSERPMISSMRFVICWALFCIIAAMFCRSSTLSVSEGSAMTCEKPLMIFSGVRTSWLTFWMKRVFILSDSRACW